MRKQKRHQFAEFDFMRIEFIFYKFFFFDFDWITKNDNNIAKTKLRFYSSFEEADEDNIKRILLQEPLERIRETVELILRVYNTDHEQLKKRGGYRTFKISFTE